MALARGDLYFLGRGVCHPAYQLVNRLGGAFLLYLLCPQGIEGIEDNILIIFIQCQMVSFFFLTDGLSDERAAMFRLRAFLDFDESTEIIPIVPSEAPDVELDYPDVLDKALERNKLAANLRRRQLEADYEVAKAKGNLRSISLRASVGYTGADHTFGNAYRDLKDNQVVEVGISIPLIDWGKRRGRVKVAESFPRGPECRNPPDLL